MKIPIGFFILFCIALHFAAIDAQGILLTNTTNNTACTYNLQPLPWVSPLSPQDIQATNCSYETQIGLSSLDKSLSTVCLAPGCNGTWQFSNDDLNSATVSTTSLPLYCCACQDSICSNVAYFTEACTAATGAMRTKNFGETWYCDQSSCVNLVENSNSTYDCADPTCTGTMVVDKTDETDASWVCQDPTCNDMEAAALLSNGNTNWYCATLCNDGSYKIYVEDYNETSNEVTGRWQCSQAVFLHPSMMLFALFMICVLVAL